MTRFTASVPPGEVDSASAERALNRITEYLQRHSDEEISLHIEAGADEEVLAVPRSAVQLFANMLAYMAKGEGVVVMPTHKMLTTQQAADLLNVSRPYLIGLLESGKIPYEMVGRHRRIRLDDLLAYRRADDAKRREAARSGAKRLTSSRSWVNNWVRDAVCGRLRRLRPLSQHPA